MVLIGSNLYVVDDELHWSFVRASGPGGQNVNKVASKAVLRWNLYSNSTLPASLKDRLRAQQRKRMNAGGDLIVTSQRFRDQERNREDALEKLRTMILIAAAAPKVRKPTRPTRGAKENRLQQKRHRSITKASRRLPREE